MKIPPPETLERLAFLSSTSLDVFNALASLDYQTRGYIIISNDDPRFSGLVKKWKGAIDDAEQLLRKAKKPC